MPGSAVLDPSSIGCTQFRGIASLSRRGLLRVGSLGVFGLGLGDLLATTTVSAASDKMPVGSVPRTTHSC
jgi:hypothetical protein